MGRSLMTPKQEEKRRAGDGDRASQQSRLLDVSVGMRQLWGQGKSDQCVGIMSVTATKVSHHAVISRQAHSDEASLRAGSWHDGRMDQERILAAIQNNDILQDFLLLVNVSKSKYWNSAVASNMAKCHFAVFLLDCFYFFKHLQIPADTEDFVSQNANAYQKIVVEEFTS